MRLTHMTPLALASCLILFTNAEETNNNNTKPLSTEVNKVLDGVMPLGCFRFPSLTLERDMHPSKINSLSPRTAGGISLAERKAPPRPFSGLSEIGLPDPYNSNSMSATVCSLFCYRTQFAYASVMNGNECRCSTDPLPSTLLVADTNCSMICTGSPSQTCGGANEFTNIYSTGYQLKTPPPLVIGDSTLNDSCVSQGLAVGLGVGSGFLGLGIGLAGIWLIYLWRKMHRQHSGRVHGEWKWEPKGSNKWNGNLLKPAEKVFNPSLTPHSGVSVASSPQLNNKTKIYQLANVQINPTSERTSLRTSLMSSTPRSQLALSMNFSDGEEITLPSLRVVNPDTPSESQASSPQLRIARVATQHSRNSSRSLRRPYQSHDRKATQIKKALIRLNSRSRT